MWIVIFLVVIIIALLGWVFFSGGGGVSKQRKLSQEIDELRRETQRLRNANAALRGSLGIGAEARARRLEGLFEIIRDLEGLRSAIAGSSICQKKLAEKYGVSPGPELLDRILAKFPAIDPTAKWKLANDVLVGEIGRTILRDMSSGASLEKAASTAGVPLVVAKKEVTRLQNLGYLDARLKPTKRGWEAIT
jgi:hypothetical protein